MSNNRIVVSGGAGFLGSHLCEKLLSQGEEVVALDNYSTGGRHNIAHLWSHPSFRLVEHDVTMPWKEESRQIYNLASLSCYNHYTHDPVRTLKTSTLGAIHLLDSAKRHHSRLLQASSSKIYGHTSSQPISEDYWGNVNPVGPRSAFDEGKRVAESFVAAYHQQYGVDARIARLFNIYGPRMPLDEGRTIPSFIISALRGEKISIQGNGVHSRTFLYVDDAVEALIRLMQLTHHEAHFPINLAGNTPICIGALAELIVRLTGSKSKVVYLKQFRDSSLQQEPNLDLAQTRLGWSPTLSLEDGLRLTIADIELQLRKSNTSYPCRSWVEMA